MKRLWKPACTKSMYSSLHRARYSSLLSSSCFRSWKSPSEVNTTFWVLRERYWWYDYLHIATKKKFAQIDNMTRSPYTCSISLEPTKATSQSCLWLSFTIVMHGTKLPLLQGLRLRRNCWKSTKPLEHQDCTGWWCFGNLLSNLLGLKVALSFPHLFRRLHLVPQVPLHTRQESAYDLYQHKWHLCNTRRTLW